MKSSATTRKKNIIDVGNNVNNCIEYVVKAGTQIPANNKLLAATMFPVRKSEGPSRAVTDSKPMIPPMEPVKKKLGRPPKAFINRKTEVCFWTPESRETELRLLTSVKKTTEKQGTTSVNEKLGSLLQLPPNKNPGIQTPMLIKTPLRLLPIPARRRETPWTTGANMELETPPKTPLNSKLETPPKTPVKNKPETLSKTLTNKKPEIPSKTLTNKKPEIPSKTLTNKKPEIPSGTLTNKKPEIPSKTLTNKKPGKQHAKTRELTPVAVSKKLPTPRSTRNSNKKNELPLMSNQMPINKTKFLAGDRKSSITERDAKAKFLPLVLPLPKKESGKYKEKEVKETQSSRKRPYFSSSDSSDSTSSSSSEEILDSPPPIRRPSGFLPSAVGEILPQGTYDQPQPQPQLQQQPQQFSTINARPFQPQISHFNQPQLYHQNMGFGQNNMGVFPSPTHCPEQRMGFAQNQMAIFNQPMGMRWSTNQMMVPYDNPMQTIMQIQAQANYQSFLQLNQLQQMSTRNSIGTQDSPRMGVTSVVNYGNYTTTSTTFFNTNNETRPIGTPVSHRQRRTAQMHLN